MTRFFVGFAVVIALEAVAGAQGVNPNNLAIQSFDPDDAVAPSSYVEGPGIKIGEGTSFIPCLVSKRATYRTSSTRQAIRKARVCCVCSRKLEPARCPTLVFSKRPTRPVKRTRAAFNTALTFACRTTCSTPEIKPS